MRKILDLKYKVKYLNNLHGVCSLQILHFDALIFLFGVLCLPRLLSIDNYMCDFYLSLSYVFIFSSLYLKYYGSSISKSLFNYLISPLSYAAVNKLPNAPRPPTSVVVSFVSVAFRKESNILDDSDFLGDSSAGSFLSLTVLSSFFSGFSSTENGFRAGFFSSYLGAGAGSIFFGSSFVSTFLVGSSFFSTFGGVGVSTLGLISYLVTVLEFCGLSTLRKDLSRASSSSRFLRRRSSYSRFS
jgi:hypothetical protein